MKLERSDEIDLWIRTYVVSLEGMWVAYAHGKTFTKDGLSGAAAAAQAADEAVSEWRKRMPTKKEGPYRDP